MYPAKVILGLNKQVSEMGSNRVVPSSGQEQCTKGEVVDWRWPFASWLFLLQLLQSGENDDVGSGFGVGCDEDGDDNNDGHGDVAGEKVPR